MFHKISTPSLFLIVITTTFLISCGEHTKKEPAAPNLQPSVQTEPSEPSTSAVPETTSTTKLEVVAPIPGDVNGDGCVNIFDINALSSGMDANGDGVVNIFDYNLVSAHYGEGCP